MINTKFLGIGWLLIMVFFFNNYVEGQAPCDTTAINRVKVIETKINHHYHTNRDSACYYAKLGFEESCKCRDTLYNYIIINACLFTERSNNIGKEKDLLEIAKNTYEQYCDSVSLRTTERYLYTQGMYYYDLGSYDIAKEFFKELTERPTIEKCKWVDQAFLFLAVINDAEGNYKEAAKIFNNYDVSSLSGCRKHISDLYLNAYQSLFSGQNFIKLNDFYKARKRLEHAEQKACDNRESIISNKKWSQSKFIKNETLLYRIHTSLANLNLKEKNYEKAISHLELCNSFDIHDEQFKIEYHNLYGQIMYALDQYALGENHFSKSLELSEKRHGVRHHKNAKILNAHAICKEKIHKIDSSIIDIQKACSQFDPNCSSDNIFSTPNIITEIAQRNLLNILITKGRLLFKLSQKRLKDKLSKTEVNQYSIMGLNTFKDISVLIHHIRQDFQKNEAKALLAAECLNAYEQGIESAYHLYLDDEKYFEAAFNFAEKSKAVSLYEELKNKQIKESIGIPDSILAMEDFLVKEIAHIKTSILENQNEPEYLEELNIRLIKKEDRYLQLLSEIKKDHAAYYDLLYKQENLTVSDIQNNILKPNQCLIEYFYGEQYLYIFKIPKHGSPTLKQVEKNTFETALNSLTQKIKNINSYQSNKGFNNFEKYSFQLNNILLPTLTAEDLNLIIIPDGKLRDLPFETLLVGIDGDCDNNFSKLNYLIKEKNISYAYSASVLKSFKKEKVNPADTMLLVAPIEFKNKPTLEWKGDQIDWEYEKLLGQNATKAQLNAFLENNELSILLLHTHAEGGKIPKIYLHNENYLLPELYGLPINAQLVILAACETSVGQDLKGEGTMSIARGFAYAGVPSTIKTLWSIDENHTNEIVVSCLKYLNQGADKDIALAKAKRDFIAKHDEAPYHWAGLVIIGDTAPLLKH